MHKGMDEMLKVRNRSTFLKGVSPHLQIYKKWREIIIANAVQRILIILYPFQSKESKGNMC